MNLILRMTLLSSWLAVGAPAGWAQTNVDPQPVQYLQSFLDHPSADAERARLPSSAQDVIVAKVRILMGPYYGIGRDDPDGPPLPKDLFGARVEIVDVLIEQQRSARNTMSYSACLDLAEDTSFPIRHSRRRVTTLSCPMSKTTKFAGYSHSPLASKSLRSGRTSISNARVRVAPGRA